MDKEFEGVDVVVGAVGSEGEHRQSLLCTGTLSTAHDERPLAPLAPGQRWSLARKRDVVLRLMQGEPAEGLSRRLAVPVWQLEEWRRRALAGIDGGRSPPALGSASTACGCGSSIVAAARACWWPMVPG